MSMLLDTLLDAERTEACARNDDHTEPAPQEVSPDYVQQVLHRIYATHNGLLILRS